MKCGILRDLDGVGRYLGDREGYLPWSCAYIAWVRLCYGLVLVVCRNFQGHSIGEKWNIEDMDKVGKSLGDREGYLPWSCAYFAWVWLCCGLVYVVCRTFQGHSIGETWPRKRSICW